MCEEIAHKSCIIVQHIQVILTVDQGVCCQYWDTLELGQVLIERARLVTL